MRKVFLTISMILISTSAFSNSDSLQQCANQITEKLKGSDVVVTSADFLKIPNAFARNENQIEFLCEKNSSVLDSINFIPAAGGDVTVAEKVAIAIYTINGVLHQTAEDGAKYIKPSSGIYYRGSKSQRLNKAKAGDIITLDRTTSVSSSKEVALGFMSKSGSQLLKIKAKSARLIDSFSQNSPDGISEQESFLLKGTKLKVIKNSARKISTTDSYGKKVILNAQFIELEEVL